MATTTAAVAGDTRDSELLLSKYVDGNNVEPMSGRIHRGGKTVIIRSGLEMQQHLPHLGHLRHLLAVPLMFPTQPALSNRPDAQLTQALLTEGNAAQRCYRLTLMVLRARLVCITLLIPLLAHTIFISRSHVTYGVIVGSAKSGHAMRRARGSSGTGGFKARNQDRLAFATVRSKIFIHRIWYTRTVQKKREIHHI